MAEERMTPDGGRASWLWTELFRTFQVALDPKKLALAAVGLVATAFGWWLLSLVFFGLTAAPNAMDYTPEVMQQRNANLTAEQAKEKADKELAAANARHALLTRLAGPGGTFRTWPWNENRGPNPFLMATGQLREPVFERGRFLNWLLTEQFPVLIEPLVKFLTPLALLFSPNAGTVTQLYLLLITLWNLVVWSFFGAAITRIAVVQIAGQDRAGLGESIRFVASRYGHYLAAPVVPIVVVAGLTLVGVLYGLIHLIPLLGDVINAFFWPILILLGFAQAMLLVGLIGFPLMYPTISAEGTDTFDALSRTYSYVFQGPWNYLFYGFIAVVYGAVLVFFVTFMGSLVVYLGKWSVGQTPGNQYLERPPENLFIYAPTSFGWYELLGGDRASPNLAWWNHFSAGMVSVWVTLVLLLVIGFGYSYFYTASTMIYLLMRHKVDDTDLDEVYFDEDEPDEPLLPPPPVVASSPTPGVGEMKMVEAPTLRKTEPVAAPAEAKPADGA